MAGGTVQDGTYTEIVAVDDVADGLEGVPIPFILPEAAHDVDECWRQIQLLRGTFTYSSNVILPDDAALLMDEFAREAACECEAAAADRQTDDPERCTRPCADCSCTQTYGCFYGNNGRINFDALPNRVALHECSTHCRCGSACYNHVVQKPISTKLAVCWTTHKGFGLYAQQSIRSGSFLCLYAGELIPSVEADLRWQNQKRTREGNYILVIREIQDNDQVLKTIVDPRKRGNVGRFMNHACPPLASHVILPIRIMGWLIPIPALFAVRDIAEGEELTWDYEDAGGESWLFHRQKPESTPFVSGTVCQCGSNKCRGYLPFNPLA